MTDTTARSQDKRTIAIDTPLGPDELLIMEMHGTETLGRMFSFELDLIHEGSKGVDFTKILGQNVSIRLSMYNNKTRYFNGYISKFTLIGVDVSKKDHKKVYQYRATMVPLLWFLTRSADCRIFQAKKVMDIVKDILKGPAIDIEDKTTGTYQTWDYCVQYRESDFNFISRLLENEGIYYYFSHTNGKHTMVFCDDPSEHKPADGYDDIHFDEPDLSSKTDAYIWGWVQGNEITPNQYALKDYDFENPSTDLLQTVNIEHLHDPGTYEIFDYPGAYKVSGDGRNYTKARLEELEAQYAVAQGTSCARGIFAGCTFKLLDHPGLDETEYLITSVSYHIENDDMGTGYGRTGGARFVAQVTCIPKAYEFRTPRTTPKPIVQGPQTAKVVGPAGEEIFTDKYGRVKVQFFWDRAGKSDENSSCWIRVSHPWAGKQYGAISIPRMGQEVIVEFLEGDPDRPIVTGRVYNGENMPPYALPDHKTMSTMKTNSSKTGGGFNEIRFEDKKGGEQVFIHAEMNMDIRVKNDRFENIDRDRHLVVKRDKFEHVKNKRHELVDVDHMEEIKGDRNLKVDGKEAKEVDKTLSLKVTDDVTEEFDSNHSEVVTKDYYLNADNIVIEGKTNVTIKVGKNSIVIDSSGISIACQESAATFDLATKGDTTMASEMNVAMQSQINFDIKCDAACSIKGTGALNLGTDGMGELKATGMLTVQATANLILKGLVVMIN